MQSGGVLELLEWNDAHRRDDTEDGLVCVDEWALGACFSAFTPEFVTMAPRAWSSPPPITQETYTSRFESKLPEVAAILRSVDGVFVAGGAACMPFCGDFGDVDLFVHGVEDTPRALWLKAEEVACKVREAFADARCVTETLSPGLLTFRIVHGDVAGTLTIQLVLRRFRTPSSALHGFDVGSCSVCYDGRVARMTRLAAFCVAHRVNVVHPPYQSPSYVHRLAKWFRRGFALVFVGMRRGALEAGRVLTLAGGEMLVTPCTVSGLLAIGDVRAARGACESDYEPEEASGYCSRARRSLFAMLATNAGLVAAGKTRFVLAGAAAAGPTQTRRSARTVLPLARYAAAEPCFADALPRAAFERYVDATVRGAVSPGGLVNVRSLKRVLGLSDGDLSRFAVAVSRASGRLDAKAALARFRAALLAKYDAVPRAVEWWVVADPSRQFTASTRPEPATPLEWYGPSYAERIEAPTKDETIQALLARLGSNAPPFGADRECPLCYGHLGERNVVTLACGHSFHYGDDQAGCLGLVAWTSPTCPMCRGPVTRSSSARRAPSTVPLEVEW
jgi:hypothetical protein